MKLFSKNQTIVALMVGLTIVFVGLFRPFHPFWSRFKEAQSDLTTQPRRQWIIEVAEAVKNPGIYIFDKPPTLYQAIQSAGGLINNLDLSFASIDDTLDTGMRVEVQGSRGLVVTHMSSRKRLVLGISIELNEACVNDLAMIPGISHGLAMRIVEFRETHGPFKTWNDLRRVKGVGPRNVEYFRSYLSLGP